MGPVYAILADGQYEEGISIFSNTLTVTQGTPGLSLSAFEGITTDPFGIEAPVWGDTPESGN